MKSFFLFLFIFIAAFGFTQDGHNQFGHDTALEDGPDSWEQTYFCCTGPGCMMKMIMFNGTAIDCDDIREYKSGALSSLWVCVKDKKVVYSSPYAHDYQCFRQKGSQEEGYQMNAPIKTGRSAVKLKK